MRKMLNDWVAVKPDAPKSFTESGFQIPETAQSFSDLHAGTVTGVGPGFPGCPIDSLKAGDRVLFQPRQARWVERGDERYMVVQYGSLVEIL